MPEKEKISIMNNSKIGLLLVLVAIIIIVLMFPKGESLESEVSVGSVWTKEDLIAPFSFPVYKDPAVYKKEVKQAEDNVYPVYTRDENVVARNLDSLKSYNELLVSAIDSALKSGTQENPTFLRQQSYNAFLSYVRQEKSHTAAKNLTTQKLFSIPGGVLRNIYRKGIIEKSSVNTNEDSVAIRIGNVDRIEPVNSFYNIDSARGEVEFQITALNLPDNISNALIQYSEHFLESNILYNSQFTSQEIEQAENSVSKYSGIVTENERIIGKHDRITKEAKLKIDSYKQAKGEKIGNEGYVLQNIGKFLHISFLIALISIYFFLFRRKIFYDNVKILVILIILLFICFITYLINQISVSSPVQLLIVIPAASMLITIIFDSRVGFYSTVLICLIAGALRGNDYAFAATNLFAGGLSVYTVRDIKNRSQIFRSFLFILLGYTVAILAFGFERYEPVENLVIEFAFAGSNALISPVLTYGLLIFFERSFSVTTDLTLLELSNFDRPLLKDLSRIAPGTFNHSMTMGTLAEAAAEQIDANPLLARVGAYYHDIGKIENPQNFVENQLNIKNIHENLTPEESFELISRHVKDGIALAKQNHLPQEIIDFIPMHHGTNVATFFYKKAKEMYGEEKVNIDDYKYPGPKPNTKETAIVMLADACESAVRAIEEPDTAKVQNVIDNIIQARIQDGQLDDSPLTFRDISKARDAFLSILIGQRHKRIKYPDQDKMEEKAPDKEENA
jgi:putative nucleotidyltransferase with HDIG domain